MSDLFPSHLQIFLWNVVEADHRMRWRLATDNSFFFKRQVLVYPRLGLHSLRSWRWPQTLDSLAANCQRRELVPPHPVLRLNRGFVHARQPFYQRGNTQLSLRSGSYTCRMLFQWLASYLLVVSCLEHKPNPPNEAWFQTYYLSLSQGSPVKFHVLLWSQCISTIWL